MDNGTLVSNSATIQSAEIVDFVIPPVQFAITSAPSLVLTKVDEHPASPPRPGQTVTYRLALSNVGDMVARNIVVTDAVDGALNSVAAPTGSVSGAAVTWNESTDARLAAIAPGDPPVELVFSAVINTPLANGSVVSNQAFAAPLGFAPQASDDPDTGAVDDPHSLYRAVPGDTGF